MPKRKILSDIELKRRSIVKALLWRFVGIIWTWTGAYVIILIVPPSKQTAALIATLIVVYHHSTRMVMYYFYERIWASIGWGRSNNLLEPMSVRNRALWTIGTIITFIFIFYLIIHVTPMIKGK
jgi:uncharacterized membrane protein